MSDRNRYWTVADAHADSIADFLDVSRETREKLEIYVDMLTKWQARINLISSKTLPEIWHRHILDSAQLVRHLPRKPSVILDMGSGAVAVDELSLALLSGDVRAFERDYARLRHEGIQPIAILRQLLSLFKGMQTAKTRMQTGQSAAQAIAQLRPPVHFKMKPVIARQLGLWREEQIADAIDRVVQAEIQTKSAASADPSTLMGQVLLGICLRARQLNARR
jgi:hypothetical protein